MKTADALLIVSALAAAAALVFMPRRTAAAAAAGVPSSIYYPYVTGSAGDLWTQRTQEYRELMTNDLGADFYT